MSESALYPRAMLIATERGDRLFRNNVGVFKTISKNGETRYVRAGLCVGSPDLIGWRSITITQEMVGMKIAQFVGFEVKENKKKPTAEQLAFTEILNSSGGLAAIVRTEEDVRLCLARPLVCLT